MRTLDKESELLNRYRCIPIFKIKYIGNFFSCLRVERLTRSVFYRKSWIDTSGKNELPPDYHNDKHRIMMDMMRVDDCVTALDGKHIPNAFEKENKYLKEYLGNDYKKNRDDINVFFVPYTDDPTKYTYKGYLDNFERIVLGHSDKVEKYKMNYPKCKKAIFFISDESNEFFQAYKEEHVELVQNGKEGIKVKYHVPYRDKRFIEIIKKCKCDYIIWVQWYKNKRYVPQVLIIDVKHYKTKEVDYDINLMGKLKEDHSYGVF